MKVRSVAAKAPSLKITNERIICDVGRLNSDVPSDVVSRYQRFWRSPASSSGPM